MTDMRGNGLPSTIPVAIDIKTATFRGLVTSQATPLLVKGEEKHRHYLHEFLKEGKCKGGERKIG